MLASSSHPRCRAAVPATRRTCNTTPSPPLRSTLRATSAAKDAPTEADLNATVQSLINLAKSGADQAVLDARIAQVRELAAAAGVDKVLPDLSNGKFKGYPLSGQTKQRTSSVITLGLLSFNKYGPKDLPIQIIQSDQDFGVLRGPFNDLPCAQVLASPFEVMEPDAASSSHKGTGLKGRSLAIAECTPVADNPSRLNVVFVQLQLEPLADTPEQLQRWLDVFLPHNPGMDSTTGVLMEALPKPAPGWNDVLLMTQQYQIVQGNTGSVTVLERV